MNPGLDDITSRSRLRALALATLAVATFALAACSSDSDSDETTTTSEAAATSTSEAAATSTSEAAATSTSEAAGEEKPESGGDPDESDLDPWERSAVPYRGEVGETVEFECPPGGDAHAVWGTDLYTDDSSVCTAGVHAGLITFEDGGTVEIVIAPGADEYVGSSANGVETLDYGSWAGSFELVE